MKNISKRLLNVIFVINLLRRMILVVMLASPKALTNRSRIASLEFSIDEVTSGRQDVLAYRRKLSASTF